MKSKHFKIHELVPKELFEKVHEEVLWRMIPEELIKTIDLLKDKFPNGSMSINNYFWNNEREWSGLRLKGSPYYSQNSQHSLFNAVDIIFSGYFVEAVRNYIINNPDEFSFVGGIEKDVGWLHLDIRKRRDNKILLFSA